MSDQPITICFDGSKPAADAISAAAALLPGRSATVVHVWRRPLLNASFGMTYSYAVPAEVQQKVEEQAADQAEQIAQHGADLASRAGLRAVPLAQESSASVWAALLAVADDADAAAIVAGSRGLSGVKSVVLGSVSNGLVHHSQRPVLIVPHRED